MENITKQFALQKQSSSEEEGEFKPNSSAEFFLIKLFTTSTSQCLQNFADPFRMHCKSILSVESLALNVNIFRSGGGYIFSTWQVGVSIAKILARFRRTSRTSSTAAEDKVSVTVMLPFSRNPSTRALDAAILLMLFSLSYEKNNSFNAFKLIKLE